jgi:3'-phosphoadenosine 5'-phosphosulfate sulfotransferase (PAPS reductase)/FAD synthetase
MSRSAEKPVRHILALFGGKESSGLAVFMKDKVPDMEYVFCDTEKELDETYEYMQRLSQYHCSDLRRDYFRLIINNSVRKKCCVGKK